MAWTTFAFGGVYAATLVVPAVLVGWLVAAGRPRVLAAGPAPALDRWTGVALLAMIVQLIPLPRAVVTRLAPSAVRTAETYALVPGNGPLALAPDPWAAAGALLLFAGVIALFLSARHLFGTAGVRAVARGLAVTGIALACLALAQDATAAGLMYWRWRPVYERAFPFGPFVNRNHFGTWAIMVVPLCAGYLIAHTQAHASRDGAAWRKRVLAILDAGTWLPLAAIVLLVVATMASMSRSSLLGMAAALGVAMILGGAARDRRSRERRLVILAGLALGAAGGAVLVWVEPSAVAERVAQSGVGLAGRLEIWRETMPILRDFWLTGTGVGNYQAVMAVYQRTSPGLIFNQAHNHYLQVAAEGGLLVGGPVAAALVAFVVRARAALRDDASGMYWLRAGAASGLAGVAAQSIFETGLLTPANAALSAVLAALVVHRPTRTEHPGEPGSVEDRQRHP